MVQWASLPLWTIERRDDLWVTKVDNTFVETIVAGIHRDKNLKIEVHATDSGRLIGYTLHDKARSGGPVIYRGPSYLGLFYSSEKTLVEAKVLSDVIYHDSNVRLLAFGQGTLRDYLFVLRVRGRVDAAQKDK